MFPNHIVRRNRRFSDTENSAIRIHPGMKFHSAFVGFLNHEFERIIIGRRRLALGTGQPFTPRFQLGRIESISRGADLHNYGIHAIFPVHVEKVDEFFFLLFGCQIFFRRPVDVIHRGHPHTPKFIFRLGIRKRRKNQQQRKGKQKTIHDNYGYGRNIVIKL